MIIILVSAQSQMLIALQEYEVRQHVPHSSSVCDCGLMKRPLWLNTFHWSWRSRCAEDPLKEAMQDGELRLMLHSFPRVSVMKKSQGYLRFWVQSPKQGLETFSRGQGRGLGIRGQGLNSRGQRLSAGLEVKATSSRTPTLVSAPQIRDFAVL